MDLKIEQYELAIMLMKIMNNTFKDDWYCENINEGPEQWTFTDGERRQKVVPRDPFKPIDIHTNIMFKQLRPWSIIISEKVKTGTSTVLLDTLEGDLEQAMLEPFGEVPHDT